MNPSEFCLVYTTAPNMDVAKEISRQLVEQKLVACANLLPKMTSIYSWEGKIEESEEVAIILKTRSDLIQKVEAQIKKTHPYTTPCVLALPLEGGSSEYLRWIRSETLD